MKFEKIDCGNGIAVAVSSDSMIITDVDSALDLLMSAKYEAGTKYIVVDKKNIIEDFFILSSGLAGEILQKFINYGGKIAIYGDFSHYTSKPLKDFIFESNKVLCCNKGRSNSKNKSKHLVDKIPISDSCVLTQRESGHVKAWPLFPCPRLMPDKSASV